MGGALFAVSNPSVWNIIAQRATHTRSFAPHVRTKRNDFLVGLTTQPPTIHPKHILNVFLDRVKMFEGVTCEFACQLTSSWPLAHVDRRVQSRVSQNLCLGAKLPNVCRSLRRAMLQHKEMQKVPFGVLRYHTNATQGDPVAPPCPQPEYPQ